MALLVRPSHHMLTLFCVTCMSLVTAQAVSTTLDAWLEPRLSGREETPPVPRPWGAVPSTPPALAPLARQLGLKEPGREDLLPSVPETGPLPNTLGLKLLGTLVGTSPSATFASIYEGPTRRTRSVWLGSDLQGAQVLAIERTRVLVLNAGRVEAIGPGGDTNAPDAAARTPPAQRAPSIRQVGPNTYEISRQQMTDSLANLNEVATQARIIPSFTNGEGRGFKVFSIRPGSLIAQLGLRNGDVLKRINGLSLASMDQALEAYSRLRDASRIELEVERDGQVLRQQYTVE